MGGRTPKQPLLRGGWHDSVVRTRMDAGGLNNHGRAFDWVGLRKNSEKMVGMVCRPCQAAGTQSEAAYERRMMGVG